MRGIDDHARAVLNNAIIPNAKVLPNNYLYVGKNGNDTTGDGSANSPYLTISKAITEATSGTTISIFPGSYAESLTLKAGVNLTSPAVMSVYITGNHTANFSGTVIIENIVLMSANGITLTYSGTGTQNLQFYNSSINSTSGDAINWTNTNSSSKLQMIDCTCNVITSGASARCFYSTIGAAGGFIANRTTFKINNPNNVCLSIGGSVSFVHTADTITGQIVVNNSAAVTISTVVMTTSTVFCLVQNSSVPVVLTSVIATTGNTYAFSGTAGCVITFMAIIYGGVGTGASVITVAPLPMAPIRLRQGAVEATPVDGTFEYAEGVLYFVTGSTRKIVTLTTE